MSQSLDLFIMFVQNFWKNFWGGVRLIQVRYLGQILDINHIAKYVIKKDQLGNLRQIIGEKVS